MRSSFFSTYMNHCTYNLTAQSLTFGREGRSSVLKAHTGTVRCVNFSADGKLLITAGDDKTVKVNHLPVLVSRHQHRTEI